MAKESIHILRQAKKGLAIMLILAIIAEILFFPTLPNLYGCFMAVISFWIFSYFLKEKYIRIYPFAFLMYLSMFMYRYLPLIATVAEGKPVTFGFERPYQTFAYEIILFLVSSLAFYLACRKPMRNIKNNFIQKSLVQLKFFEITPAILWGMGLIGLLIRLYNFAAGNVEYGDVAGKFLAGLNYLMYAPLCLVFPSLLHMKYSNRKILWMYGIFVFILNIASNSRRQIIIPIGIIIILFFLYVVLRNLKITDYISPMKLVLLGLFVVFGLNLLSNISLAMLHTRKIRADVNKTELFQKTIETFRDDALMNRLRASKDADTEDYMTYREGWTEYYIDNFMLARYANMRITDQTLYYAEKRGYANRHMQLFFEKGILATFPTPILRLFGIKLDKNTLEMSSGDMLYGKGFGGYRVTSHVGDGLATFGYWYFLIQFVAFFLVFKLLNSFVFYAKGAVRYAPFALISVFTFLGMFRNAGGVSQDISYIIRGFAQGVFTYLVIFYLVRFLLKMINSKYVKIMEKDGSIITG